MEIYERISSLMTERSVTAAQLSRELDLSTATFTQWKQGKQKPSLEAVVKLAQYFGTSADYLLGLTDNPTPPKKEYTVQDKLNREIDSLTPEKRVQAETYIRFLKTETEFGQELTDALNTSGVKLQTE